MTTAQIVKTSVTVNISPIEDYVHPDDHTQRTYERNPGFKTFTIIRFILSFWHVTHFYWIAATFGPKVRLYLTFQQDFSRPHCSRDIYFQFKKVRRSVILRAIMQRLYESASAIGCQECTTKLINFVAGGKLNNECSTLLFSPFISLVSQNHEYADISQWTFKSREYIHFALFCGNFVEKLNHRRKDEIFHLF